jgi:hypothetical protein
MDPTTVEYAFSVGWRSLLMTGVVLVTAALVIF